MFKNAVIVLLITSLATGARVHGKKEQQQPTDKKEEYVHGGFFTRENGNPNYGPIVNLFQWSYDDIAKECKEYLGKQGFSAVQVTII